MVEIALIDQLVDMKDSSAKPAFQALLTSGAAGPDVRERAQWAIGQLQ